MVDPRFQDLFRRAEALQGARRFRAAQRAYTRCLDLVDPTVAPRAFALAAERAGACAHRAGAHGDARDLWSRILTVEGVDPELRINAAGNLAVLEMDLGVPERAAEAVRAALVLAESGGQPRAAARQLGNLGVLDLRSGDLRSARRHFLAAAERFGTAGDAGGQAQAWNALGEVAMRLGEAERAARHFEEAFAALAGAGAHQAAAVPRANRAHLLRREGRCRKALELYGEVCAALGEEGDAAAGARLDLSASHMDLGDWPAAAEMLGRAEALAATPRMKARVAYQRADWQAAAGRLQEALERSSKVLEAFKALGDLRGMVAVWTIRARLRWRVGQEPERLPEQAFRTDMPDLKVAVEALAAERALAAGDLGAARKMSADLPGDLHRAGDRVRGLKAEAFLLLLDLVEESVGPGRAAAHLLRIFQDLSSGGAIRDAVAACAPGARALLLLGHAEEAERLLEGLRRARSPRWPESWQASVERTERLGAWIRGEPIPVRERAGSEDLDQALIDRLLDRPEDPAPAFQALRRAGRHFLLTLLTRALEIRGAPGGGGLNSSGRAPS